MPLSIRFSVALLLAGSFATLSLYVDLVAAAPVLNTTSLAPAATASAGAGGAVNTPSVQTLTEQCQQLAKALRVSAKPTCNVADSTARLGVSMQQRPIFSVRSSPTPNDSDPERAADARNLRVLVLGAIHGDELSAGWLALQWLGLKAQRVDGTDFSVMHIPLLNPDGLFHGKPSRTNASGVDLNRNFPTPNWQVEANKWWVNTTKRDKRRWPGKTAGSEIETQHVMTLIKSFKPSVIVAIHAPLGVLDYDGAGMPPERIGSIWLDSVGIYPGSLGHYSSRTHGIPVLTVELPNALKVVSDAEALRMWRDLFAWVKRYAQHDAGTK